jgi:glycosyltransferase involved in cell wall biosynthesis
MKILHISSFYIEDLAKGYQVYELVREQIANDHQVHIITSASQLNYKNYQEHFKKVGKKFNILKTGIQLSENGAVIHRLPTSFELFGRLWLRNLSKTIRTIEPDYIIIHSIFEFQTIRILFPKKNFNIPIVVDDHTTINVVRKDFIGKLFYKLFNIFFAKYIYSNANKIIGISDSCIGVLNTYFGISGGKVVMIPLGTNQNIFYRDYVKRKDYRNKLNLIDNDILIVYTGKIYEDKKVHLLIDALNLAFIARKRVVIHIVGTLYDNYSAKLNKSINNSKFRVELSSNLPNEMLAYVYNAADLCVWPAHTTTSTLDASACGCPIICSDYKKERYDNNNGIGVKEGDLTSLINALEKIINNDILRKEMGINGQNLVKNKFSWESISKQFISFS